MATTRKPKPPTTTADSATEREVVRRKPVRKDQHIIIRVTVEQKAILRFAADKAGEGLSGWILSTVLRAASADRGGGSG